MAEMKIVWAMLILIILSQASSGFKVDREKEFEKGMEKDFRQLITVIESIMDARVLLEKQASEGEEHVQTNNEVQAMSLAMSLVRILKSALKKAEVNAHEKEQIQLRVNALKEYIDLWNDYFQNDWSGAQTSLDAMNRMIEKVQGNYLKTQQEDLKTVTSKLAQRTTEVLSKNRGEEAVKARRQIDPDARASAYYTAGSNDRYHSVKKEGPPSVKTEL